MSANVHQLATQAHVLSLEGKTILDSDLLAVSSALHEEMPEIIRLSAPKFNRVAPSSGALTVAMNRLLQREVWFSVTPWPNGQWSIEVKSENAGLLKAMEELR